MNAKNSGQVLIGIIIILIAAGFLAGIFYFRFYSPQEPIREQGVLNQKLESLKPQPSSLCKVEYDEAPDLELLANAVDQVCETNYPQIIKKLENNELQPPFSVIFKKFQEAPGLTSGSVIYLSADWFRKYPDDLGAVVHEMAHVVQGYTSSVPFWLIEGIADYIRYWLGYQNSWSYPHCENGSPHYTSGYWCSAAFLQYIEREYDKDVIGKLNSALRNNNYKDSLFLQYTGKGLESLWEECQKSDCAYR